MNNKNKYISIKVFIDAFFSFSLKMKLYINAYELENWEGNGIPFKICSGNCCIMCLDKSE